ncbi:hypothetical protein FQN54_003451 [Arachnomyces sp. PD_36]|nr:hypothetical protein FQN54_003451 [Arachnomyces sp. PD_36]
MAEEHILIVLWPEEPKALVEDIRAKLPGYKVTYFQQRGMEDSLAEGNFLANTGGVPIELWQSVTILVTLNCYPNPGDCPNLKFIHSIAAGFDHLHTHPVVTKSNVPITSSSGIHGPPIGEWVVMNWLVSSKLYNMTYEWQKEKLWGDKMGNHAKKARDHAGKRVGILGYGSIGRHIARLASAMGMEVLAYTSSPRPTPESRRDDSYVAPNTGDPEGTIPTAWYHDHNREDPNDKSSLHNFLSQNLDHLVICTPLTKSTTGFIGAKELSVLSAGSSPPPQRQAPYLTNISRGKIIDQPALIDSLHSGKLRGAALDVTYPEPLPDDHPLWDAPNVSISPHLSGLGVEYMGRAIDCFIFNLKRWEERGEEGLVNLYMRKRGY